MRAIDTFNGPAFLRFEYFRYLEHVGVNSDVDEAYRERDSWSKDGDNDPVLDMREKLINVGELDDVVSAEKRISEEVEAALEFAKSGEFSDKNETYKDVFDG